MSATDIFRAVRKVFRNRDEARRPSGDFPNRTLQLFADKPYLPQIVL